MHKQSYAQKVLRTADASTYTQAADEKSTWKPEVLFISPPTDAPDARYVTISDSIHDFFFYDIFFSIKSPKTHRLNRLERHSIMKSYSVLSWLCFWYDDSYGSESSLNRLERQSGASIESIHISQQPVWVSNQPSGTVQLSSAKFSSQFSKVQQSS